MRCRAAVLRSYEDPFTVEDVLLRTEPAPGEILVEIAGAGMCRTDLAVRGSAGRSPLPAVLGHEGAGVVVRAAPGGGPDAGIGVGDHVVLSFDSCGHCPNCRAASPAYCDSFASLNLFGGRAEQPPRLTDAAGKALAPRWFGQSSFAEYALVPARNAVRVDPALPVELLGPLGCGFLTGAGAVLNTFGAGPGDTLVVLGAGA
ncbi:alcohol dehydrogenase catalytic domain-containing protein, partial [Streptomyces sp. SID10116]|nr:alcohol dehydrogenase catalytic domain-containing protein [Streptomyces sp. SID10116]